MINTEAAEVLVKFAGEIKRYAVIGDVPDEPFNPVAHRAGENAWRLTSKLIDFLEAAKESDFYWKLLGLAIENEKSDKEQFRLRATAKSEDFKFMMVKGELEKMLKEMLAEDKKDPQAKKLGKAILEARAYRAENREKEREERNRKARERRANAKAEAQAIVQAAAKKTAKRGAKKPAKV